MAMAKVSTATTKRYGDSGSPCRTPRSSVKKLESKLISKEMHSIQYGEY